MPFFLYKRGGLYSKGRGGKAHWKLNKLPWFQRIYLQERIQRKRASDWPSWRELVASARDMTQPCNESTRLQTQPSQSTSLSALRGPCLDEVRRCHGVPEDTVKFLCSGGEVPFRKNHEQETKQTFWEHCAKCKLMSTAGFPWQGHPGPGPLQ